MKRVYKSKIDYALVVVVMGVTLLPMLPAILTGTELLLIVLISVLLLFEIVVFTGFRYVISDERLIVKTLFVFNQVYFISEITEIRSTHTILSSPAASMDRLAIYFSDKRSPLVISPRRREHFIEQLTGINPDIIVG